MKNLFAVVFLVCTIALVPREVPAQFALNVADATGNNYHTPVNYFKSKAVPAPAFPYNWSSTDLYQIWERLDSICTPSAVTYTHYNWRNTDLYQIWLKLDSCFSGSAGDSTLPAWSLTGNAGTSPATNFIGTTDNNSWVWKTNNIRWAQLRTAGQLWLNHSTDSVLYDFDSLSTNPVITGNTITGDSCAINAGATVSITPLDSNYLYSTVINGPKAGKNIVKGVSGVYIGAGSGYNANGGWGHAGHNPGTPFGSKYELTAVGAYTCMFPGDSVYESSFYSAFAGQFNKGHSVNLTGLSAGRYNKTNNLCVFGNHSFESLQDGANGYNAAFGGDIATFCLGPSSRNSFFGGQSALALISGSQHSFFGALTGINQISGNNDLYLGYYAGNGGTTQSQAIRIGDLAGQFLNKSLTGILGTGNYSVNATSDSGGTGVGTGFYQEFAATPGASSNKSNGRFFINDETQAAGRIFTCVDANGQGIWAASGLDTTANDSATINAYAGVFKVANGSATFTLINNKITNITTKTFFQSWNPGNSAHLHINSKAAGVVIIGFDPAPNQDTKVEFQIRE